MAFSAVQWGQRDDCNTPFTHLLAPCGSIGGTKHSSLFFCCFLWIQRFRVVIDRKMYSQDDPSSLKLYPAAASYGTCSRARSRADHLSLLSLRSGKDQPLHGWFQQIRIILPITLRRLHSTETCT